MSTVGRYALLRRIGVGGMAEVWRAKAQGAAGFAKTVAIKRVLAEHAEQSTLFNQLFVQEAKIAAELSHPNIVQVHDFGQTEKGEYFIAMEYVAGRSLSVVLDRLQERRVRMSLDWALFVTSEACRGLGYAHALCDEGGKPMRIVHRDVSPHNILVSWHGDVKVTDFGIAKAASSLSTADANKVMGKIAYMSPEQARGQSVDHRSDLFGLGLVLFEQLAGERFFVGGGAELYMRVLSYAGVTPEQLAKVPVEVHDILRRALAIDPNDRFRNALDMEAALLRNLPPGGLVDTRRLMSTVFQNYFAAEIEADASAVDPQSSSDPQVPSYATISPKEKIPSVVDLEVALEPLDEPEGPSPLDAARVALESGFGARMPWQGEGVPAAAPFPASGPSAPLSIPAPPAGKLPWNAPIPAASSRTPPPAAGPDPRIVAAANAAVAEADAAVAAQAVIARAAQEAEAEAARLAAEAARELLVEAARAQQRAAEQEAYAQARMAEEAARAQAERLAAEEAARTQPPLLAGVDPFFGVAHPPTTAVTAENAEPILVVGAPLFRPAADRWKQAQRVVSLAASKDGARAVTADGNNSRVWDVAKRREITSLKGHRLAVTAVSATSDASFVLSASRDGALRVWDVAASRTQHVLEAHTGGVTCAQISDDGWLAISGGVDGRVCLWDLVTAKATAKLSAHQGAVNVVILVDENRALSAGEDGTLHLWSLQQHRSLATLRAASPIRAMAVVQGGRQVLAGTASGSLALIELDSLTFAGELCGTGPTQAVIAAAPEGGIVASGDSAGLVHLWDLASATALSTFELHDAAVTGLAFLDGGERLLSCSDDRTLAVWTP